MAIASALDTYHRGIPDELGYLDFLRRRLEQTSPGWTGEAPDDGELIAKGRGEHFWEVIGLRVEGCPGVLLGAVDFRRQQGGGEFARQSLPSLLAMDARVGDGHGDRVRGLLPLELPTGEESVPEFLQQLGGKTGRNRTLIDKDLIQLVFDLRARNPSAEKLGPAPPSEWKTVVLRTREGHVVTGNVLGVGRNLRSDLPFFSLTMGVQHTVHGTIPLPTLFLQRRYVAMLLEFEDAACMEGQLSSAPFRREEANPLHLVFED